MGFGHNESHNQPSSPAHAGDPVRRGGSISSLASLEYRVARSSRAMTAEERVPLQPSLRAQAKQSSFLACCAMDCFAALAMTLRDVGHTFAFSRRVSPEACKSLSPMEGVGNAGCQRTRSRACSVDSTRVSHHGYAETPGIPARDGVNGLSRTLPGDRAFLPPSLLRRFPGA